MVTPPSFSKGMPLESAFTLTQNALHELAKEIDSVGILHRCIHCQRPADEHAAGWCLFQATRYLPHGVAIQCMVSDPALLQHVVEVATKNQQYYEQLAKLQPKEGP